MTVTATKISPFGSTIISADSGADITISSPVGTATAYFKSLTGTSVTPDRWIVQDTVSNSTKNLTTLTAAQTVKIEAGVGPVTVSVNTSPNLAIVGMSAVQPHNLNVFYQGDPATAAASFTATSTQLASGLILVSDNTTDTITLLTATAMDTAFPAFVANDSLDFIVSKIGSNTCTIVVNTGITDRTPSLVVNANSSARFRLRKTATAAYDIYRLN